MTYADLVSLFSNRWFYGAVVTAWSLATALGWRLS
jgi:hypothetical protein